MYSACSFVSFVSFTPSLSRCRRATSSSSLFGSVYTFFSYLLPLPDRLAVRRPRPAFLASPAESGGVRAATRVWFVNDVLITL